MPAIGLEPHFRCLHTNSVCWNCRLFAQRSLPERTTHSAWRAKNKAALMVARAASRRRRFGAKPRPRRRKFKFPSCAAKKTDRCGDHSGLRVGYSATGRIGCRFSIRKEPLCFTHKCNPKTCNFPCSQTGASLSLHLVRVPKISHAPQCILLDPRLRAPICQILVFWG